MINSYSTWKHGQDYQVLDLNRDKSFVFITGNHQLLAVSPELGGRLRDGLHALLGESEEVAPDG